MINNPNLSVSNYKARKNHLCPKCNEPLKAVTVGNVVNSGMTDKKGRFPLNGSNLYGSVKSYNTEYQCSNCRLRYSLDDLKKIEQSYKKTK